MNEIALVLGMAGVTFLTRYPILALSGRIRLPPTFVRALRFIPPAVLTAIVVPAVLMPSGDQLRIDAGNAQLIASLIAVLVAWRTRNLLATILLGMLSMWIWRALIGG